MKVEEVLQAFKEGKLIYDEYKTKFKLGDIVQAPGGFISSIIEIQYFELPIRIPGGWTTHKIPYYRQQHNKTNLFPEHLLKLITDKLGD